MSDLFPPEFLDDLQGDFKLLQSHEKETDRIQWSIGRKVQDLWDERESYYKSKGYTFESFCAEVANKAKEKLKSHFKSGGTIRRWCNVYSHYQDTPRLMKLIEVAPFEAFFEARRLAKENKVTELDFILYIVESKASVESAILVFDPPVEKTDKEKAIVWLESVPDDGWIKLPADRSLWKSSVKNLKDIKERNMK